MPSFRETRRLPSVSPPEFDPPELGLGLFRLLAPALAPSFLSALPPTAPSRFPLSLLSLLTAAVGLVGLVVAVGVEVVEVVEVAGPAEAVEVEAAAVVALDLEGPEADLVEAVVAEALPLASRLPMAARVPSTLSPGVCWRL